MVENGLHTHGNFEKLQSKKPAADLPAQVREWAIQKAQDDHDAPSEGPDGAAKRTIFVLEFGVWDIWQAVKENPDGAKDIVTSSIDIIFRSLDDIHEIQMERSKNTTSTMMAVVPLVIDMTFLPGYTQDPRTMMRTVELIKLWNSQLTTKATEWRGGDLFLYDMNGFILDHIRARQMLTVNAVHSSKNGSDQPLFANVATSCTGHHINRTGTGTEAKKICSNPDDHLFW